MFWSGVPPVSPNAPLLFNNTVALDSETAPALQPLHSQLLSHALHFIFFVSFQYRKQMSVTFISTNTPAVISPSIVAAASASGFT